MLTWQLSHRRLGSGVMWCSGVPKSPSERLSPAPRPPAAGLLRILPLVQVLAEEHLLAPPIHGIRPPVDEEPESGLGEPAPLLRQRIYSQPSTASEALDVAAAQPRAIQDRAQCVRVVSGIGLLDSALVSDLELRMWCFLHLSQAAGGTRRLSPVLETEAIYVLEVGIIRHKGEIESSRGSGQPDVIGLDWPAFAPQGERDAGELHCDGRGDRHNLGCSGNGLFVEE